MWSRPPDFLIFTGLTVYLVGLFQDTNLVLRSADIFTGGERATPGQRAAEGGHCSGQQVAEAEPGAVMAGEARLKEHRALASVHRAME